MKYYDWTRTLSYDADVSIVIGSRGKGKTYGLRKQFVLDWLKHRYRFVEICRYVDEVNDVREDYFDKLVEKEEFPRLVFKTDRKKAYVAFKPKKENEKVKWHVIGYFVALTQMQRSKKKTFVRVKRIVMDEAVIDRMDRYHRYLPNEYGLLANVVDSCTRENPNDPSEETIAPHLYLLGNAVDISNPYFARYGIVRVPAFGYTWYDAKTCMLHYIEPGDYAEAKLADTLAGRMVRNTRDADTMARNVFIDSDDDTIGKKPKDARYIWSLEYMGARFDVWVSTRDGYYYVCERRPKDGGVVYALSTKDNRANQIVLKRCDTLLRVLMDAIYSGLVKYSSVAIKRRFLDCMAAFGLR